ncbi:hypothetical protein Aoc01nite_56630 [Actinoplanes octamycinicus]|nr:hypothetical protein Aoc01nite_56630 [Actinoplanes octamycinicus]
MRGKARATARKAKARDRVRGKAHATARKAKARDRVRGKARATAQEAKHARRHERPGTRDGGRGRPR